MKNIPILLALLCASLCAQNTPGSPIPPAIRWAASTGDTALNGAGTTATIQQPAANAQNTQLEQIVVYCSVACNITQAANGAAATATAGTITAILPNGSNNNGAAPTATFWTASNVGAGTAQGGIYHMVSAGSVVFCLNTSCGATQTVSLAGTNSNYSVTISSITGTTNITMYGSSF